MRNYLSMGRGAMLRGIIAVVLVSGCGVSAIEQDPPRPTSTGESSAPPTTMGGPSTPDPGVTTPVATPPVTPAGPASLHDNRDRLIDTLATRKQLTRCALWSGLTPTQRGVFLTITDLLGKRSFLTNDPAAGPRSGVADLEMALDHVTLVYEIRDSHGSNGGGDNNRIWLSFDTQLITAMRSFDAALPEWDVSHDLGGPHDPFDATSETIDGQPRGQSQFWSSDAQSKPLKRPGVEGIDDPHIVEIDIDYNWLHDSNPEADYFPDGKGRDHYVDVWATKGIGTSPEFDYVPTTCTP